MKIDLSTYDNSWYKPGNNFRIISWYFISYLIFNNGLLPVNSLKILILKCFGAQIGKAVVIKPRVKVKYPWHLSIGDHVWIGEDVWIDNLGKVDIKDNVCISQGAMLLCGNHNYTKGSFDLIVGEICIKDGSWIGAQSIVCSGVTMYSHSILSVGSVATKDLDAYSIYQGNPAIKIRERKIN